MAKGLQNGSNYKGSNSLLSCNYQRDQFNNHHNPTRLQFLFDIDEPIWTDWTKCFSVRSVDRRDGYFYNEIESVNHVRIPIHIYLYEHIMRKGIQLENLLKMFYITGTETEEIKYFGKPLYIHR